ncbi:S4 domain-containing protein YaaA [Ligilactobacillus cholophilus]|uniref:S4 domain-containing protein YaaA n=1 Tax=Ligilactobacillus cholophilus TaxID=3050131 RepID=UPI0025AF0B11|nr:S4 domain-containing protein YaaA [Ligilactobacillus cholophilus]
MQEVVLKTPYITLGQLLKIVDVVSSGGEAKWYLSEHEIYVNDELDNRRGRKLYPDDKVKLPNGKTYVMRSSEN